MSLVNWDCLIVDERSKPTNGIFVSPLGIRIEVFEDSLRLYPKDDSLPTWQIYHGEIRHEDVFVLAERGPRGGIYFAVYSANEDRFRAMVGIACKGFDGSEYVGVEQAEIAYLREILVMWDADPARLYDRRLGQISFGSALRFNQADAQVAHKVGSEVGATAPGESRTPVVAQAINVAREKKGGGRNEQ